MDYIVKSSKILIDLPPVDQKYYDIYIAETVKDINDIDVTIPKFMGCYSMEKLEQEKTILQSKIEEIDAKILAINNIIKE